MSKVYILNERDKFGLTTYGVVSSNIVAEQFINYKKERLQRSYIAIGLDDPELLNRIAKESEDKSG